MITPEILTRLKDSPRRTSDSLAFVYRFVREDDLFSLIAAYEGMREALSRSAEGWANAIELGLLPRQHVAAAEVLRDEAKAALALLEQEGQR